MAGRMAIILVIKLFAMTTITSEHSISPRGKNVVEVLAVKQGNEPRSTIIRFCPAHALLQQINKSFLQVLKLSL